MSGPALTEMGGPPRLDKSALDELRQLESGDTPGFFADVCRQFVADAGKRIDMLEEAARAGDTEVAGRHAHSLKSMAATVGAERLSGVSARLERAAREGRTWPHEETIGWLRGELEQVARELEAAIAEG